MKCNDQVNQRLAQSVSTWLSFDPRVSMAFEVLLDYELSMETVLRTMCAVVSLGGLLDWRLLHNPSVELCLAMAATLETLAAEEDGESAARLYVKIQESWPFACKLEQLVTVAVFRQALPISCELVKRLVGGAEYSARLRSFAGELRANATVS